MNNYYDENASTFFKSTVNVDMAPLYKRFLPLFTDGGQILDAGCGSGRDTKQFENMGYNVTAFDSSQKLCELASTYVGQSVLQLTFSEVDWHERFDAVWACASLLHLSEAQLIDAIHRLITALKVGGIMYCSFKWGNGERQKNGRYFIDMNEQRFHSLLAQIGGVELIELWETDDRRPMRKGDKWLNAILKK